MINKLKDRLKYLALLAIVPAQMVQALSYEPTFENSASMDLISVIEVGKLWFSVVFVLVMSIRLFKLFNAARQGVDDALNKFIAWLLLTIGTPIFIEYIHYILINH